MMANGLHQPHEGQTPQFFNAEWPSSTP